MSDQHVSDYVVTSKDGFEKLGIKAGTKLKFDSSDGRLYDAKGNQVAKFESRDDERNGLLADYASEYEMRLNARALSAATSPQLAGEFVRANLALRDGDDENLIKMDLGPSDVHIPSAMPDMATGYRPGMPIADLVCPVILAQKQVDDYFQFAKEDAFQRVQPVAGAGGGQVPEVSPRLSNAQYSTKERTLGGYVSTQLEANADAPLKLLQATTKRIMNALILEREIRVQALLRNSANWNASNVVNLGTGFQWDEGASSNPVRDLQLRIEASWGDVTGVVMSEKTWHAFIRNPVVRGYYAYKSNTAAVPTPQQMTAILELPPIYVSKMKYINSSGALDYVWGPDVVLIRQPEEMPPSTGDDVATAYTFRWNVQNPKEGVSSGGFVLRQFYNQFRGSMGGLQVIAVHHDAEQFTSGFVGGLIQNAFQ